MANVWNKTSMLWKVDSKDTNAALTDLAPGFINPIVYDVVYIPAAADNAVTFQTGSSEDAIVLKAGASDASPVHLPFIGGRHVPGLKCTAITAGTVYVYLK
jgi:hypothetical protein